MDPISDKPFVHERAQQIADAIEVLRVSFMGELMKDHRGWAWEYRMPRDPILPFAISVFAAGDRGRELLVRWCAQEIPPDLFKVTVDTGVHFNGCSVSITPILIPE